MKKRESLLTLVSITVALIIAAFLLNSYLTSPESSETTFSGYTLVATFPHDINAFTEGLAFQEGHMYEGTGLYGMSSLRLVDLETGNVLKSVNLSGQFFGEGITILNDKLYQLTWKEQQAFVYDKLSFNLIRNFTYSTEGWGITNDGTQLIMSDGTAMVRFLNPETFQMTREIQIHDNTTAIANINELEYVKNHIYANVWLTSKIAIINPQTGLVEAWVNLEALQDPRGSMNGIAYDAGNDRFFITGKRWQHLYEIRFVSG